MKQGIHPEYKPAIIICSCGNTIETMSTQDEIHVEICSVCHPFYTGRQRLVDTAGRVERFKRKYETGDKKKKEEKKEEKEKETAAATADSGAARGDPAAAQRGAPPEEGDGAQEAADAE